MATDRRGQAMIELAFGMLALALVLAALFGFTSCILDSLKMQRTLRREAGQSALTGFGSHLTTAKDSATVAVEPFAAEYIFGRQEVKMKESVSLPNMGGLAK